MRVKPLQTLQCHCILQLNKQSRLLTLPIILLCSAKENKSSRTITCWLSDHYHTINKSSHLKAKKNISNLTSSSVFLFSLIQEDWFNTAVEKKAGVYIDHSINSPQCFQLQFCWFTSCHWGPEWTWADDSTCDNTETWERFTHPPGKSSAQPKHCPL